jgi:hypothetical protein
MYLSIYSLIVDYIKELVLQEILDINYRKGVIVFINRFLRQAYDF